MTTCTITRDEIRRYLPTTAQMRQLRKLCAEHRTAKAAQDRAEQIDVQAKRQVLEVGDYRSRYDGERITDPRRDYEMYDDADLTAFTDFCKKTHAARVALGSEITNYEMTTDCYTYRALQAVEDRLLEWAVASMPPQYGDIRRARHTRRHFDELLRLLFQLAGARA